MLLVRVEMTLLLHFAMHTTLNQLRSALCNLGVLFQSYFKYYQKYSESMSQL